MDQRGIDQKLIEVDLVMSRGRGAAQAALQGAAARASDTAETAETTRAVRAFNLLVRGRAFSAVL